MTGKQSLLRFPATRGGWRWPGWIAGALLLLCLTACDRPGSVELTAEGDEPHFRRGRQLLGSSKPQALEAFQKVIDKRQGDAPESHFEVGRIYLEHFNDQVAAIYHFRRYLALRPNGNYATHVAQMIQTAEKEYMRKFAGNPLEAQNDRLDLLDRIKKLEDEKAKLAAEVDRLTRTGASTALGGPPARTNDAAGFADAPPVAALPPGRMNAGNDSAPLVAPVETAVAPQRPAPPADSGRVYVVQQGDTLVAISRKIYGSPSRWRAIYELNRERIPDPNALKIGAELRLP